jgi:hypothetical protein
VVVWRESETIMADLMTLGLDAAAGGVFGIIGTAFGRVAGFFERRDAYRQEKARWEHEYRLHELNMKSREQESKIELALANQVGSWSGLKASIEADAAIGRASKWVINLLRLVRPSLTFSLWLITAGIFLQTQNQSIVEAAVFAATASTLWWFGDRAPKPNYGVSRQ